jgi:hypothetical protein
MNRSQTNKEKKNYPGAHGKDFNRKVAKIAKLGEARSSPLRIFASSPAYGG